MVQNRVLHYSQKAQHIWKTDCFFLNDMTNALCFVPKDYLFHTQMFEDFPKHDLQVKFEVIS